MSSEDDFQDFEPSQDVQMAQLAHRANKLFRWGVPSILFLVTFAVLSIYVVYTQFRIDVPTRHMAILMRKTGDDLKNNQEIANDDSIKGVQQEVLGEGRYFRNPYNWDWEVVQQVEIPAGALGVRVRLHGKEPPAGLIFAREDNQKGIVPEVLRPGRYAINAFVFSSARASSTDRRAVFDRYRNNYAELIELHKPIIVPAGFKGVVTLLSAPLPEDPNVLLVQEGKRGVQRKTLDPGTYYVNPYEKRINLVDCRAQRFDISKEGDMGFPSKDGFWVSLDGVIEYRVDPEMAADVFVKYNDESVNGDRVDDEITKKIILPNTRSFCRLRGSNYSGREFISGDTRVEFQEDFQKRLAATCSSEGIKIVQALITTIRPPQKIASPVRDRQIALQEEKQFQQQILQQDSEQQLAIEQQLVKRSQAKVAADQEVIKVVTAARRKQEVALIEANQRLGVAKYRLEAAEDTASAVMQRGEAAAAVINFNNTAEAAGWKKSVEAFGGDGNEFARWVMMRKLAPAYRKMMVNTADSRSWKCSSNTKKNRKASSKNPPLFALAPDNSLRSERTFR